MGNKYLEKVAGNAFSMALAGESVTDELKEKFDFPAKQFNGVTHDDLYQYAKIIANKVHHNLQNGHTMPSK